MSDTQTILIQAKFHGLYDTGLNEPDLQGLASRFNFIRPREDDRVGFTRGQHVIKEPAGLSHFIDRIPKTVMDFVPDPPPSDDPLLQRPEVDFESQMMLVMTTHNPNRFADPQIVGVELASETMLVHWRCSEPSPVVQKVISYGKYLVALVSRFDGDVQFVQQSAS